MISDDDLPIRLARCLSVWHDDRLDAGTVCYAVLLWPHVLRPHVRVILRPVPFDLRGSRLPSRQ
jgi:hypothetical protein